MGKRTRLTAVPSKAAEPTIMAGIQRPTQFSEEDLALYGPALQQWREAANILEQVKRAHSEAAERYNAALGAATYLLKHFAPKYQLGPNDEVNERGEIQRPGGA